MHALITNPSRLRWVALPALMLMLLTTSGIVPARAHAELLRSDPSGNAVLTEAPRTVEMYFSEEIADGLSSANVLDTSGNRVDLGDAKVDPTDPTHMSLSLQPLADGVYTVGWSAFSPDDGHLEVGAFSFAVGEAAAVDLANHPETTSAQPPVSGWLSKWAVLLSLVVMLGHAAFMLLIWRPTVGGKIEMPAGSRAVMKWTAPVLLAGILASIVAQVSLVAAGQPPSQWWQQAQRVLYDSQAGSIVLARLGLGLVAAALILSEPAPWKTWAQGATAMALLLSISLTSHAASARNPAWPVLADWLHLTGAGLWVGGLPFLALGLRSMRQLDQGERPEATFGFVRRFGNMALISVMVIGLTGLYSALLRVGTWEALANTPYGKTLMVKQFFVACLLVLAALNRFRITPRLKSAKQGATAAADLGYTVGLDLVLGALLILSVAILTYIPPARAVLPNEITGTVESRGLNISMDITPGTIGRNRFEVHVAERGRPSTDITEAVLRFNAVGHDIPQFEAPLEDNGEGNFSVEGNYLSLPGQWQVQAVAKRDGVLDAVAYFNFGLTPPQRAGADHTRGIGVLLAALDGLLAVIVLAVAIKNSRSERSA
jgi:copper transport protein